MKRFKNIRKIFLEYCTLLIFIIPSFIMILLNSDKYEAWKTKNNVIYTEYCRVISKTTYPTYTLVLERDNSRMFDYTVGIDEFNSTSIGEYKNVSISYSEKYPDIDNRNPILFWYLVFIAGCVIILVYIFIIEELQYSDLTSRMIIKIIPAIIVSVLLLIMEIRL